MAARYWRTTRLKRAAATTDTVSTSSAAWMTAPVPILVEKVENNQQVSENTL